MIQGIIDNSTIYGIAPLVVITANDNARVMAVGNKVVANRDPGSIAVAVFTGNFNTKVGSIDPVSFNGDVHPSINIDTVSTLLSSIGWIGS